MLYILSTMLNKKNGDVDIINVTSSLIGKINGYKTKR